MFKNFFENNKGRIIGNLAGPIGIQYGPLYDIYNSMVNKTTSNKAIDERLVNGEVVTTYRDKTNPYDFGMSYASQSDLQPPKATYSSKSARDNYNNAVNAMNSYKIQQSQKKDTYDPMANIEALYEKDKKRSEDDEEDSGPSLVEKYLRDIQRIQAGNFQYSSTEKKQLENLKATGRQAELRQSRVNENYMGGTLQGELRSGRSRYAQEIADDAMINAMQVGTDAINELDLQTSQAVTDLEQAIKEDRLRQVAEKYGLLQEQDRQRSDEYSKLQERLLEYAKLQNTITNQSRASLENDYNLAVSQGYRGTYRDFLQEQESNKLLGKYAPQSSNSGSSSTIDSIMAWANS